MRVCMTCDDLSVQALPEMEIVILFPYNVRPIDPFGYMLLYVHTVPVSPRPNRSLGLFGP